MIFLKNNNLIKLNVPSIYTLIKIERFQKMKPIRKNNNIILSVIYKLL